MAKYALGMGLPISVDTLEAIDNFARPEGADITPANGTQVSPAQLAKAHTDLVELVKPMAPRTLMLFTPDCSKRNFFGFPNSVPLVEHLTKIAMACIVIFVIMSTLVGSDAISLVKQVLALKRQPGSIIWPL